MQLKNSKQNNLLKLYRLICIGPVGRGLSADEEHIVTKKLLDALLRS